MMSEKRFYVGNNDTTICDRSQGGSDGFNMLTIFKVVDLLNEQQATISTLKEENKQLHYKIIELQDKLGMSEKVIDDETFEFNKNCAKPYEIRSVSPNGVVRVGKKNSKVSWRMKDVREISAELPHFEDFNRETFMQMRNKFRKFDKDVLGRIIYNIYKGTFGDYL